jgi:hypothetical protein
LNPPHYYAENVLAWHFSIDCRALSAQVPVSHLCD